MTIQMVEEKILTFSSEPDPQGDIILPESVEIAENLQIFKDHPTSNNFITFAKAEAKEDGVYVQAPAASLEKFKGMFLAPEGQVQSLSQVRKNGRLCRVIKKLKLNAVSIVPQHVDPNIKPMDFSNVLTPDKPRKKSSTKKRRKVTVKSSKGRSSGADSSPESSGAKPRFKRRRR